MPSKHKSANRTKDNARPANSNRSTELLRSSLTQLKIFSLATVEELDTPVDPNLQVILKKIGKKDSTTKIKGLQELAEFIKNSKEDTLKEFLPLWPRYYNTLATDIDHRIREATHNVQYQIVSKAKRNLAPYLRQIMAPWFTSQYDMYAPAASIATQAMKAAFSGEKFQQAIIFCQKEILGYIQDNLLNQTAQTLSNPKHISVEEAEAKYERVVVSCLHGYRLYFEEVPKDQINEAMDLNNAILSNGNFWRFSKNKAPHIRSAWFRVITAMYRKAPNLLREKEAQAISTVLLNLEETDPVVIANIWEAFLSVISAVPNWWDFIKINKVFLPKLWKVLKNAGSGNASVIYPNLLPMISYFPPTLDDLEFYNLFFENFRYGMKHKPTSSGKSEANTISTAFIECFRYIIMKKQTENHLCKTLIKNHLISTIEWCLTADNANYKPIFNELSTLFRHWEKSLTSYLEFSFGLIMDVLRDTLFNLKQIDNFDLVKLTDRQLEFLQALKHTNKISKKQFKARFAPDSHTELVEHSVNYSVVPCDTYMEKLDNLAYGLCKQYVSYIEENRSRHLMEVLWSLLYHFSSRTAFQKVFNGNLLDIYQDKFLKWLESDDLRCKFVVDLMFLFLKYLDTDEKHFILQQVFEIGDSTSLAWCISKALSHPHDQDPDICKWFKMPKIGEFILSIVQKQIKGECEPEHAALLKLVLRESQSGDILLEPTALKSIVSALETVLNDSEPHSTSLQSCISLAVHISSMIYSENALLSNGGSLLYSLFRLSCKFFEEDEVLSEEDFYEMNTAWQDALTILILHLPSDEGKNIILTLINIIDEEFLHRKNFKDDNKIGYLIQVTQNLFKVIYESTPLNFTGYVRDIFERCFMTLRHSQFHNYCKIGEYINGGFCFPHGGLEHPPEVIMDEEFLACTSWNYLHVCLLEGKIVEEKTDDEDEEEQEGGTVKVYEVIDKPEEFIGEVIHDLCMCESYLRNFKNTNQYEHILNFYCLTEYKLQFLLKNLNDTSILNLRSYLKNQALQKGWFWCTAFRALHRTKIDPDSDIYVDFVSGRPENYRLGFLHLVQAIYSDNFPQLGERFQVSVGKFRDLIGEIKHSKTEGAEEQVFMTTGKFIILKTLLPCEEMEVPVAEAVENMDILRNTDELGFPRLQANIEAARLCVTLVQCGLNKLSQKNWSSLVCCLEHWASKCLVLDFNNPECQALEITVVDLYINIDDQVKKLQEEGVQCSFVNEWQDILMEVMQKILSDLWLRLSDLLTQNLIGEAGQLLIEGFGRITPRINEHYILQTAKDIPEWTKFLVKSCDMISAEKTSLQFWGYKMLLQLILSLKRIHNEESKVEIPEVKSLIFRMLKEKLAVTQEIVTNSLSGIRLGEETCSIKPGTDTFTYTLAYLMIWDVIFSICDIVPMELRFQYVEWLRESDNLKHLCNNLFCLFPPEVLQYSEGKSKSVSELFLKKPRLEFGETFGSEKIEAFACWLYTSALTQLPATVRQWWTSIEPKFANIVDKVTSMYVSPHLCAQEQNNIVKSQGNFKNMTVKVILSSREIVAIYTVEDAQIELMIILSSNYPLGGLEVECSQPIIGTNHKQWLLQFKKLVLHQNGRIWDGLALWNSNLDRKFENVEECYICFSVLHSETFLLPKLACPTCKKKFHTTCLYKWFGTSCQSSCPICRSLF